MKGFKLYFYNKHNKCLKSFTKAFTAIDWDEAREKAKTFSAPKSASSREIVELQFDGLTYTYAGLSPATPPTNFEVQ
jgi:hypothetical protein